MKRRIVIRLVIGLVMCNVNAMSQQATSVPLNDLVTIDLPKGAIKLSSQEFRSTLRKNDSELKLKTSKGEFYKINDINMRFVSVRGIAPENYLENLKKGSDDGYGVGVPKSYSSVIKSINNYRVLIVQFDVDTLTHFSFFSVSNTGKGGINGSTDFNISDRKKNTEIIDKILKSIYFK